MTIRVAVADDSSFIRKALARLLGGEPGFALVGSAASGEELLAHLERWAPDVVILDLSMPGMGGLATLDRIMAGRPTPVIILSTHSRQDAPATIEALHRGAMDFVDKQQYSLVDFEALRAVLVEKIRQVTRREGAAEPAAAEAAEPLPARVPAPPARNGAVDLVLLGASTGGPLAIETVLRDLGPAVPAPVVVVQHMPAGFTRAFADRLNAYLPLQVREAADEEPLAAGTVYIAPGGRHLRVVRRGGELHAALADGPEDSTHRPSVDVLFVSARAAVGGRAVAVLLTGMGRDGAEGMAALAGAGGVTIAQDEASSVVYGMPRAAVAAGGAREVLPLAAIGERLRELLAPGSR
ncbi:MAG TPA: chemotaxis-specific protein-glutamate methyltransferase CheB [Thermoanaerobaculia bacterium]|nr:chemotaxis-specific protein-glutamate methyltransferase CheB [Thermoanaerobaculia bacterium]